jgi:hypothetical protein
VLWGGIIAELAADKMVPPETEKLLESAGTLEIDAYF